jgi:hypothetical protein
MTPSINQSIDRLVKQSSQSIEQSMSSTLAVQNVDITKFTGISFVETVVRHIMHRTVQRVDTATPAATRTLLVELANLNVM